MKPDIRIKVNNFLKKKFDVDNKSFISPVPDGKEKENDRLSASGLYIDNVICDGVKYFYLFIHIYGADENSYKIPLVIPAPNDKNDKDNYSIMYFIDRGSANAVIESLYAYRTLVFNPEVLKKHKVLQLKWISVSDICSYHTAFQIRENFHAGKDLGHDYYKKIFLARLLLDSTFESLNVDYKYVKAEIPDLLTWIFSDCMYEETFIEIAKIISKYRDLEESENYDDFDSFYIKHSIPFSEEVFKIVQTDNKFNQLLDSLPPITLLTIATLDDNISRHVTPLGVSMVALFCITEKKHSVTFNRYLHSLIELVFNKGGVFDDLERNLNDEEIDLMMNISLQAKDAYNNAVHYLKLFNPNNDNDYLENQVTYGESKTLEFKASSKYSLDAQKFDKNLYYPIIKSICAFANTDGGLLIVGYDEKSSSFVGIEQDGFKDTDKWENYIRNHLDEKAGKFLGSLVDFKYKKYYDKTIALIETQQSQEKIMCKDINNPKEKKFYVRTGAYTKALDIEEAIAFIDKKRMQHH